MYNTYFTNYYFFHIVIFYPQYCFQFLFAASEMNLYFTPPLCALKSISAIQKERVLFKQTIYTVYKLAMMRASSSCRLVFVAILCGLLIAFCSSTTTTTLAEAKKVPDQNRFPAVPLDVLLRQPFRLSLLEETTSGGDDDVNGILSKINAGLGELVSTWMGDSATALLPFFGPGAGVVFNVANNSGRTTGKTLDTRRAEATGLPVVDYTLLNGTILTPSSSSSSSSPISFTIEVLIETYYSPIFEEDTPEDREERKTTEREPESQVARSAVTMKLFRNVVSSPKTEEEEEVTAASKTLVAAWATHVVKGMPAEEAQAFCKSLAASSGATPATELASRRLSIKPLSMRVRAPGALEAPGRYCLYPTNANTDAAVMTGLATLRFNNYQEALFQVYPPATTTTSASPSSVFPVAVIHLFSKRSILDTVSLSQMLQGIAAPTDLELLFDDAHTVTTAPNTLDDVPQYYVHSPHGKQQKYLSEQHSVERVGLGGVASATAGSSSSSSGFGLGIVDATALDSFLPDPQLISARIDGAFLFFYSFYTWSCENWHLIAVGLSVFVSKLCMSVMQNQKDRKDLLQQQMNAKAAAAAKTAAPPGVVDSDKKGSAAAASNTNKKGNKSSKK